MKILIANFPAFKEITAEILDVIFVPKVIAKQLALAVALQTGVVRACVLVHVMWIDRQER